MRRFTFLWIVLCCSLVSPAQRQGFQLGISGSYGMVRLKDHNLGRFQYGESQDRYWGGGISAGVLFTEHVGCFSGLEYELLKWRYDHRSGMGGDSVQGAVRQGLLSIPISLQYLSSRKQRAGCFLQAGVYLSFLCSVRDSWQAQGKLYENTRKEGYTTTALFPFLNAGLLLPLGAGNYAYAGPCLQYQSTENFNTGSIRGHLASVSFRMGLSLHPFP